jgi:hypothetical protein
MLLSTVIHKERDMAKRIFAHGVLALLLAMQLQADAAGNGNESGDCTLLASIINTPVLYASREDLTLTGLRKNQNRLPNGAMTIYRPAGCYYTTTINRIAESRVLRRIPLHSGLMTYP